MSLLLLLLQSVCVVFRIFLPDFVLRCRTEKWFVKTTDTFGVGLSLTQAPRYCTAALWRNSINSSSSRQAAAAAAAAASSSIKQQQQAGGGAGGAGGGEEQPALCLASLHVLCAQQAARLHRGFHQRKMCALVSWNVHLTPVTSHPQQPSASAAASDHQPRPPLRPSKTATRVAALAFGAPPGPLFLSPALSSRVACPYLRLATSSYWAKAIAARCARPYFTLEPYPPSRPLPDAGSERTRAQAVWRPLPRGVIPYTRP